jgi:MFS family permease
VAAPPPSPADETPGGSRTPTSVRVAITVLWVMCGLLLLVSALSWLANEQAKGNPATQGLATSQILLFLLPYLLLGLLTGVSAWGLGRRQAWARWTGLGAAVMLFALMLLGILAAGALALIPLLLLVLSMAAGTSLVSRSTAQWVPRLRDRG